MARFEMVVSDLDGTLLGEDVALQCFADWYRRQEARLRLVYASGRFFESVVAAVKSTALPAPDAIIGGVGTVIHLYPSGELLRAWHTFINRDWDGIRVRLILSSEKGLEPQPNECQSAFKVSYYMDNARAERIQEIRQRLQLAGINADLIYSSKRDLDIVPSGANKGSAAHFLASIWSIPGERVVVSGDSGNDRSLYERGFRGIVVSNAHEELRQLRGASVYHASRPFAAGVLEGLEYWTR